MTAKAPDEEPSPEGTPFEDVPSRSGRERPTEAEAVLLEMLELERAAAAFYAELLERVKVTPELSAHVDAIADMAEEEAEHAELVEALLERRGIAVVVEE